MKYSTENLRKFEDLPNTDVLVVVFMFISGNRKHIAANKAKEFESCYVIGWLYPNEV